jgi:hypothetical protein
MLCPQVLQLQQALADAEDKVQQLEAAEARLKQRVAALERAEEVPSLLWHGVHGAAGSCIVRLAWHIRRGLLSFTKIGIKTLNTSCRLRART